MAIRGKIVLKNALSLLGLVLFACSKPIVEEQPNITEIYQGYKMNFIGRVDGFDGLITKSDTQTRADENTAWIKGDKLFILFDASNGKQIAGEAEYNEEGKYWQLTPYGALPVGENMKCEVRYFENINSQNSSIVELSLNSAIYEDANAKYSVSEEKEITLNATLYPKTSRLRYSGAKEQQNWSIYTAGITIYNYFNRQTGKFSTSNVTRINQQVSKDGTTDYIYGLFPDDNSKIYCITNGNGFTRYVRKDFLKAGESGYMSIPNPTTHTNWQPGLHFTIEEVDFSILNAGSWEFCGETEVTEELYQKIMNGLTTNSQLPQTNVTRDEANTFASKLSQLSPFNFRLISFEDWRNAASRDNNYYNYYDQYNYDYRDYIYSGSNDLDEVAWHAGNCTTLQPVKQKQPNKWGFYDLNGNAAEWSYNAWLEYNGEWAERMVYMGGSYLTPKESFTSWNFYEIYTDYDYKSEDIGFRLYMII